MDDGLMREHDDSSGSHAACLMIGTRTKGESGILADEGPDEDGRGAVEALDAASAADEDTADSRSDCGPARGDDADPVGHRRGRARSLHDADDGRSTSADGAVPAGCSRSFLPKSSGHADSSSRATVSCCSWSSP